jgi:hypothetical protein
MTSWHPGCPVPVKDLRVLTVSYWGFDGRDHRGRLIANEDAVSALMAALRDVFAARFRIHRMEPVELYGSDDNRSMAADNTSAFNCRGVTGSSGWSETRMAERLTSTRSRIPRSGTASSRLLPGPRFSTALVGLAG